MRSQLLAWTVLLSGALMTGGCTGGTSVSPTINGAGSVAVFGSDTPICNVLSFTVTITSASLRRQGGGALVGTSPVALISPSNPVTVDFAALMDFSKILNFANVPAATYDKLTLSITNPQITILGVTQNPSAPVTISATLLSLSVTVDIQPPLIVTNSGTAAVKIDFDLRKSVEINLQSNPVTGAVNPVFRVRSASLTPGNEAEGEVEDLKGLVQTVKTSSTDPAFAGSFDLANEAGQKFTVAVTAKTKFENASGLGALTEGTFVEVRAFVDSRSNVVAQEVDVGEPELGGNAAFVGLITKVESHDSRGMVTQFNLFVREEAPDDSGCVPPKTLLLVNVMASTQFKMMAGSANFGSLTFDATALGPGQAVIVHGTCQPGITPTVNALSVFLRPQTVVGNFSQLLGAQSDGKTGGFGFTPCAIIFQGQPVTVFTSTETAFAGVANLNALRPLPTVAIKGLLLYEQQPLTLNNVTVTPASVSSPAVIMEAVQVHQLG